MEEYYYLYHVCDYGIFFTETDSASIRKYFDSELSCEQACDIVSKYDRGEDVDCASPLLQKLIADSRKNQLPYEKTSLTLQPQQFVQEHKQLQIVKLADIITEFCKIDSATKIMDMGGGVGHLAREIKRRFPGNDVSVIERSD